MATPLQTADEALAAHTKHIGGMVNELGDLLAKLTASHEHEYQRGFSEGYSKALQSVFAACGVDIKELQS